MPSAAARRTVTVVAVAIGGVGWSSIEAHPWSVMPMTQVRAQATAVAVQDPTTMALTVPVDLMRQLARANPEAAMVLHALVLRSSIAEARPPVRGDGRADRLSTTEAVLEAIQGAPPTAVRALTRPFDGPGLHSRVTWELVPREDGARLVLTHRIVDDRAAVVGQPYTDVVLSLQPERQPDGGRAWRAMQWRPVH